MKVQEIKASSIITKSNLPDSDYVINPYVGCTHACVYCYACFMKRFTGHEEDWGTFVDVKVNSAELVPEKTSKYKGKNVFMCSVTDPYLHIEKKYGLTRKVLEKLVNLEPKLGILTKSDLVIRDIDIFKSFEDCEVGLTITTLDDDFRKEIEPYTSPIKNRIEALKKLKEAGIKTYVFIGPIFPYFTDWKAIVEATKDFADSYIFENLNIAGTVWGSIKNWLKKRHLDRLIDYERIYFSNSDYWSIVENEIKEYCDKNDIRGEIYFHHKDIKKK